MLIRKNKSSRSLPSCSAPSTFTLVAADQPEVRADDAVAADRPELALLQHAQQLDLQRHRHLGDLVKQQRSAVGHLHQAHLVGDGPGERALLVTEELGFHQLAWNRGAVDLDERPHLARAVIVDRRSHQLLARAVLPLNQHARVGRRDHLDHVEQLPHRVTARHDVGEVRVLAQLLFQPPVFGRQLELLARFLEHGDQQTSGSTGFSMNVNAPLRMASTAFATLP